MRISGFVFLVLATLSVIYGYLGWSLAHHPALWVVLALPLLSVAAYPLVVMGSRKDTDSRLRSFFQWLAYFGMAYFSFLAPLTLARDIASLVLSFAAPGYASMLLMPVVNVGLMLLALAMLVIGVWTALSGPRIHEVTIRTPRLPKSLNGLRIAQISDLHVGLTIKKPYVERVTRLTNSLNPDLIAMTGDIADGKLSELREEITPLADLKARLGVYYATGNHEYYWNGPAWIEEFKRLGSEVLLNSNRIVEHNGAKVLIGGVLDPASAIARPGDGPNAALAAQTKEKTDFKILLAHHPGAAPKAADAGFDLQLSGHTHGGQFFPWTLVVRKVHRFHVGEFTQGEMKVYVNPGTGSWGPPVRLGTRPEITLIKLESTDQGLAH